MIIGRDGKPEARLPGREFKAPCRTDRGCPKGTPEDPRTLWPANEIGFAHYLECKAVWRFPDDPIVQRNAAIIRSVENEIERRERQELKELLIDLREGLQQ